jgi:hypothetical protein
VTWHPFQFTCCMQPVSQGTDDSAKPVLSWSGNCQVLWPQLDCPIHVSIAIAPI